MTRNQLRQRIVRNLGGGMIKTELCVEHLDDAINTARDLWITYAVGNATMEVYFLLLLKAKQHVYDLPAGLIEVIGYEDKMGGIGYGDSSSFGGYGPGRWYTGPEQGSTSFFALSNPEWGGLGYNMTGGNPVNSLYTMVDSYLALSHMELIKKMRHDKYQWRYHRFNNQIEIIPTPECGNQLQVGSVPSSGGCPGQWDEHDLIDSPGYVMIRGTMMEGCSLPTYTPSVSGSLDPDQPSLYPEADENMLEYIYSHPWIIAYSTAFARETLGLIRRKFANNSSLGNASISLDGDSLVSEGREDKQRLEEELDLKWSYEGYGIEMG
jgi:hypothetical protein